MTKKVEVNGKSYESAVEKGLGLLGLKSPDEAVITILKDNGFLFNKYKLVLEKKMTDSEIAVDFIENFLSKAGYNFAVETVDSADSISINIIGVDSSSIIGYHGEVLDALQYLVGVVVNKGKTDFVRVTVDTEGYREKRTESLKKLAHNLEKKVERTKHSVSLEPMNAYERRIIHFALQNSLIVSTHSEGDGIDRHVIITPKKAGGLSSNNNKKRQSMNFVYSSDKKKRSSPLKNKN